MILSDLSAAFDTLDHQILVNRLQNNFGIEESALCWFQSYLSNRFQFITIKNLVSDKKMLRFGVPQGSVLGPILFNLYTAELSAIIQKHNVGFHKYADDTQLYCSFDPRCPTDTNKAVQVIENGIIDVSKWMQHNVLKLNKTVSTLSAQQELLDVAKTAEQVHQHQWFHSF